MKPFLFQWEMPSMDIFNPQVRYSLVYSETQEDERDIEDDFTDEDEENDEPDYWECLGCMRSYGRRPMGGMCDSCGSYVEEGYY